MLSKKDDQAKMIQYVNLGELVPKDHLLRRIRKALNLDVIYALTKDCYSPNRGRPSVDPTVAFRMILLGYLFNLSETRMCEEVAMHAGYRWFCDLDFNSPVPDRTTLVKLRRHTWGEGVFQAVMEAVVQQCIDADLVKGKAVVIDGSQVKAKAAVTSLEAIAPVVPLKEYLDRLDDEEDDQDPPPPTGGRKAGDQDFRGEQLRNETHRSKTDPDARLFRKGRNVGAQMSYLVHDAVDLKSGVILSTGATLAYGRLERPAALALLDGLPEQIRRSLKYALMDANYTEAGFLAAMLERGMEPIVPRKHVAQKLRFKKLRRKRVTISDAREHRLQMKRAKAAQHVLSLDPPPGLSYRARTRIERVWAEAKEQHGLHRARGIGLEMMNIQALLTATAQNLRRLAKAMGRQQPGTAAGPSISSSSLLWMAHRLLHRCCSARRIPVFSPHF